MYQDTMNKINAVANERLNLYLAAGKHSLSAAQMQRLHELDGQLPLLWDQYRREFAGRSRKAESAAPRRAA